MNVRWALGTPSLGLCVSLAAPDPDGQTAGFSGAVRLPALKTRPRSSYRHDQRAGGQRPRRSDRSRWTTKFRSAWPRNAKVLITEEVNVAALFLSRGTPTRNIIAAARKQFKAADQTVRSGRDGAAQAGPPWVFNVAPPTSAKAERAVQHLSLIGIERIGVIHVDDKLLAATVEGARRASAAREPVFVEVRPRQVGLQQDRAAGVSSDAGGAVSWPATGGRQRRRDPQGWLARRSSPSEQRLGRLRQVALARTRGVIVTQVFPYERSLAAPIVKEAHDYAVPGAWKA